MDNRKETILIVDDERLNLNVLVNLLEDYDTLVAKTGEQALKRVRIKPTPDLILLDIMMPGMDGYQVLQRLQADEDLRSIPVIFITAMGEINDETKGLELGAVDYITKPISPAIVKARVKTHLTLKRGLDIQKDQNQRLLQLNDELVDKNQQLIDLNQIKNKFLGIAAHDLRNPLAVIIGMSQLIAKKTLDENKREHFLTSIYRTSRQMLNLVNDLLDVAIIESGKFDLHIETADLQVVIKERLELLDWVASKKMIKLHAQFDAALVFQFDSNRIGQVIDNLLSNAIKFSPPHTSVFINCVINNGNVDILIKDNGQGIPENEQDSLFGTFAKTSVRPTDGEKSTGLGLAIVKKIVEAHQGSIKVQSTMGEGSTFVVTLPVAIDNQYNKL